MQPTDAELEALYDRYAPVLLHRCRTLMRNDEDAREAVQETFARVIRNWESFRHHASPLTWMYRISTNYCLNQLRNTKSRRQKRVDHKAELGGDPITAPVEGGVDESRVLALLASCDAQTRACVVHTFFDDCTRQETADLVGISVPTVRKRVNDFLDLARRTFQAAAATLVALAATGSPPWN